MQNDVSKEGDHANATIICLTTNEKTKLFPGNTNGLKLKQHLQ
jgi:hypothetical protein